MKQIILEDRKGFIKIEEVFAFPPQYTIATPIKVGVIDPQSGLTVDMVQDCRIVFYPKGAPVTSFGVTSMLYKEY